jgi:hypothetical protein
MTLCLNHALAGWPLPLTPSGRQIAYSRHTNPHAAVTRVERDHLTLMITPPSTWTDAHNLMEGASERRLIGKAHLIRNIGQ